MILWGVNTEIYAKITYQIAIFSDMKLNINADAVVKYTNTLEKMSRSALPVAIRTSLNSAAFDVKQVTMPRQANAAFVKKQPNFFKANSQVEMAKGFDIKTMKSTVGFVSKGLKGGSTNFAVKDLQQQESGGRITNKSFIPLTPARGGSKAKPVRPGNRLSSINRVVNSNSIQGKSKAQKFRKAAVQAGVGGHVIGNDKNKILWKVESIGRKIKLKALYSFKQNRSVSVKGTGFMKTASLESASKIEKFYIAEAKKQIKRLS